MFENLSAKLSQITRKLINQHRLNENDINDFLRQIRMALLEADVNFKVVKSLIDSIKTDTINPEFSKPSRAISYERISLKIEEQKYKKRSKIISKNI